MYWLVIVKKDGDISEHYYDDYEELDYNAVLCQFSSNILKVTAQKDTLLGWKTLFTIQ
jgi:hypothetical protein